MISTFSVTNIGKIRKMNQDYVYSSEEPIGNLPNLFLVADGMGGHKAGDYASKLAVSRIVEEIADSADISPEFIFSKAIHVANRAVKEASEKNVDLKGMGTTIVAASIDGNILSVANVGDSRLYIVNSAGIRQITTDHSWVEEMIKIGEIPRNDAKNHPDKNIITRAVGIEDSVQCDFYYEKLVPGDTVLICTDGLTNMVDDTVIMDVIGEDTVLSKKCTKLIDLANAGGGKDNISITLIEFD